ncbi:16S rRNA (guanine(966)-N(2))-methyltransferase RsmD [Leucobacter soli]|uniref:Ribosomal RNA small subunit methyltransferase D n=1 Tax=Leucobacter soli TaxID=2812850 RepID=A0A916NJ29_9MICO|nr:16S rRNA (guanine(966)-N(2))-methyltransferase RsmD [Leucobacter soli]CAG7621958.1 Ribosomal RNA small subunit methyltransferase D [Leucobacter soli]
MTRIIAGAAGSLRLEVPKAGTRPTSDRVREAVFSALESWDMIAGSRVLDLYAGSGALGLEAISRGSSAATLVERHPQAAQVAQRNARTVAAAIREGSPRIDVVRQGVQGFLEGADPQSAFDVVLIDPPYDLGEAELTANLAALPHLLAGDAVVLVERSSRSPEPSWPAGLTRIRERRYGETVLWWAERADRADGADAGADH